MSGYCDVQLNLRQCPCNFCNLQKDRPKNVEGISLSVGKHSVPDSLSRIMPHSASFVEYFD
jgi:hypothetical protein